MSIVLTRDDFLKELKVLKNRFASMEPILEVTLRDPEMDVEGYIVVWNTAISKGGPLDNNGRGCGKGGTRILPDLELHDVKRLARAMAQKNAAAGLHLGGAKSGLRADPNAPDYEQKYRRFVKLVQNSGILTEDGGIFGGFGYDIGGKPPLNAQWACDELGTLGSFTGKPVEMGGTDYDKVGIAGLGVAVAAKTLLEIQNHAINKTTFSVQGIGAMGAAVIRYFSEYGAHLNSLSDPKYGGTWTFKNSASDDLIKAISDHQTETVKSLLNIEGTLVSNDSSGSLYQPVDVVFPCALEDSITKDNAHNITAPYIAEGANNPTTDEAHAILYENGTLVVPDIIANPGGIIAAYVELSSNVTPEENVKTRAKVTEAIQMTTDKVSQNTRHMMDIVKKLDVEPYKAGDYIAYRHIFYGIPKE